MERSTGAPPKKAASANLRAVPAASERVSVAQAGPGAQVDVEAFARNAARMIEEGGKALAAYIRPREDGALREERAEEVTDVVKTLGHVLEYWLADPQRAVEMQSRLGKSYLELFGAMSKRMAGEEAVAVISPDPKDKRFSDPEWTDNQFFDFLKQAYLLTSDWANHLVSGAEGLDPHTRHKAEFYIRQISNALSPSNFVMTNPEVLRETMASNAENLVRGMQNLAEDIQAGGGELRIRQSDGAAFEVGRNLATAPGKVIFQNDLIQLIQYAPSTPKVLAIPLLIVPPWINKFYVLDLTPDKSLIKWCVDQGLTVFCISWVNPDARLATKGFDDYMREGPLAAIDAVKQATGAQQVHAMGYCVGGTLLSVALAYLASKGETSVKSVTLLTTQVDFTHAGDLKVFAADEEQIAMVERQMAEQGFLAGSKMAAAFNLMRSNDLIWPYVINNYLRGRQPVPFDMLYWNSDATRMPAANHSFYMRGCYLENRLSKGTMTVANQKLDLKKVTLPIYNLATREDHIAPARSVFLGSTFFGGPVKFVLSGSGHMAGVVNHPAKKKYQYWTGAAPKGDTLDQWLLGAEEHVGSWWPDWLSWLKSHDESEVDPRVPGDGPLKPIEDAPGSYVKVRS
ncbi:MAG: PHA/PHB synthase family protein [Xanthobacteraceae bacterium]